jgi:hypothetical protein
VCARSSSHFSFFGLLGCGETGHPSETASAYSLLSVDAALRLDSSIGSFAVRVCGLFGVIHDDGSLVEGKLRKNAKLETERAIVDSRVKQGDGDRVGKYSGGRQRPPHGAKLRPEDWVVSEPTSSLLFPPHDISPALPRTGAWSNRAHDSRRRTQKRKSSWADLQ